MQLLRPGDRRIYVQYLTLALIRSGYWETITDSFDDNLKSAVIAFQNDNNLTPDDVRSVEFLNQFSQDHMTVAADFATAGEGLDNYFLFILEDVYY